MLKKLPLLSIIILMDKDRISRQIYTHIPVYSGDVSGAASALYEFGGMTVIHDPSGCNSTYNTHDELRWVRHESAVFISGLRESDAVNGNDDRLIDDTVETAFSLEKRPSFIALCNSPVPDIIATDFNALSRIIEKRTGIPTFYIRTNAMHDYTVGATNAFYKIAEKFLTNKKPVKVPDTVNLFGLTPFEYPHTDDVDRLYDLLEGNGLHVCANWGMGSAKHPVTFSDIEKAVNADVTLVLSSTGLKAADYLYTMYGIPYVVGNPLAGISEQIIDDLRSGTTKNTYMDILGQTQWKIRNEDLPVTAFIGEPVTIGSEAAAYALSHPDRKVRLICATETTEKLISHEVICPHGEAEIAESLMDAAEIHGDPLLQHAIAYGRHGFDPSWQIWIDKPHLAMSGRMYL